MSDKPNSTMPKKRILIVDDDVYNRDFYKEILLDAGYNVETSANGEECIARLQSDERYDLILLDIVMPVKDGLQTLRDVENQEFRKKHGEIYMLSALGQDSVLAEAKAHGSTGYIVKTDVTPEEFLSKIGQIIHERQSTTPTTA
jgi:CheY-like chemotaxis protein